MKKLFTVLAVLLVATALFAQVGLTVKAGGAFGFTSYKSVAEGKDQDNETIKFEDGLADKALVLKDKGFGFDVGVQYDITDNLLAYVDFNMLFPKDAKVNISDPDLFAMLVAANPDLAEKYFTDDHMIKAFSVEGLVADLNKYLAAAEEINMSTKYSFFSVSAGAAYKLDFNGVKLNVGGGVTLNKATAKLDMAHKTLDWKETVTLTFTSFGLNAMVEAKYMVADGIGVGVTVMPQLGLYNKAEFNLSKSVGADTEKASITAKGFAVSFAMPIVVGVSYTF